MDININYSSIFQVCAFVALIIFACLFPGIIFYIFLAYIFSLICKPLVSSISKVKIFKYNIPLGLSTILVIFFYMLVFVAVILFFVPTLIKEVRVFENINYEALSINLNYILNHVQNFLYDNNLMDQQQTIVGVVTGEIEKIVDFGLFSNVLGNIVSSTSSFFFGLFAVLFIAFFIIKDDIRLENIAQVFFSKQHAEMLCIISNKINNLLSRYFIGTLIKMLFMVILIYIGLALFGIKGALFLAFIGGILNVIPYLGPVIGAVIACLFGTIDCLSTEMYIAIIPTIIKIIVIFVASNMVDNMILQPMIYSQSVKAHPVEIFLATIIGGNIAGIAGMLLAIPVYTIIRVIIIEIYQYINTSANNTTQLADK